MIERIDKFPSLSSVNSIVILGSLYYLKKVGNIYSAWDYKSGLKVVSCQTKQKLISFLEKKNYEIRKRIDEHEKR